MLERYDYHRPQMETGDCILWQNYTQPVGLLIHLRTGAYKHISAVVRACEYGVPRVYFDEAMPEGTERNCVSNRLRNTRDKVYWAPLIPELDHLRFDMGVWLVRHEGVPYDFGSLFKNAIARVSPNARKLFCSEYWWMALLYAANLADEYPELVRRAREKLGDKAPTPSDIPGLGLTMAPRRIK